MNLLVLTSLLLAGVHLASTQEEGCWVFEQRGRAIKGYNDRVIQDVATAEVCAQACLDESTFDCASIEFKAKYNKCFLSTATRASAGDSFGPNRGMLYRERELPCGDDSVTVPVLAVTVPEPVEPESIAYSANLALNKAAYSSNQHFPELPDDIAVDGSESGDFGANTCSQTSSVDRPWWLVDLGKEVAVGRVEIINRADCCGELLNGAIIMVAQSAVPWSEMNGLNFDPAGFEECARVEGEFGLQRTIDCPSAPRGRYVAVYLEPPEGEKRPLTLCEVKVFAILTGVDQCDPNPCENGGTCAVNGAPDILYTCACAPGFGGENCETEVPTFSVGTDNVALNRPAVQCGTTHGGVAGLAVDGNDDGGFTSPASQTQCTHTNSQATPWWSVDLGEQKSVGRVELTNRADCCEHRLLNAVVAVGDSAPSGATFSPENYSECGRLEGAFFGTRSIACDAPTSGRYVVVYLPGSGILTLCEVKVFLAQ